MPVSFGDGSGEAPSEESPETPLDEDVDGEASVRSRNSRVSFGGEEDDGKHLQEAKKRLQFSPDTEEHHAQSEDNGSPARRQKRVATGFVKPSDVDDEDDNKAVSFDSSTKDSPARRQKRQATGFVKPSDVEDEDDCDEKAVSFGADVQESPSRRQKRVATGFVKPSDIEEDEDDEPKKVNFGGDVQESPSRRQKRVATGFVKPSDIEEDEDDEPKKVNFGGDVQDSPARRQKRVATGFVKPSDIEDEEEDDEPKKKVNFGGDVEESQSPSRKQKRAATGFVKPGDIEDDEEEAKSVSFGGCASPGGRQIQRETTGAVRLSDLPSDSEEDEDDKRVSFDPTSNQGSGRQIKREPTGVVRPGDLPEEEDEDDDKQVSFDPGTSTESGRRIKRVATGAVRPGDLPPEEDEDEEDDERHVDFDGTAEHGTPSSRMRAGTAVIRLSQISALSEEGDDDKNVTFGDEEASSPKARMRAGTKFMQHGDLPGNDEDEDEDGFGDMKVKDFDKMAQAFSGSSRAELTVQESRRMSVGLEEEVETVDAKKAELLASLGSMPSAGQKAQAVNFTPNASPQGAGVLTRDLTPFVRRDSGDDGESAAKRLSRVSADEAGEDEDMLTSQNRGQRRSVSFPEPEEFAQKVLRRSTSSILIEQRQLTPRGSDGGLEDGGLLIDDATLNSERDPSSPQRSQSLPSLAGSRRGGLPSLKRRSGPLSGSLKLRVAEIDATGTPHCRVRRATHAPGGWNDRHHLCGTENWLLPKNLRKYFQAPQKEREVKEHLRRQDPRTTRTALRRMSEPEIPYSVPSKITADSGPPLVPGRHAFGGSMLDADCEVRAWNDRWGRTIGELNEGLHPLHRQYFTQKSLFEAADSQRWRRYLDMEVEKGNWKPVEARKAPRFPPLGV